MPSLRSRLLVAFLRATSRKALYVDVELLRRRIAEERRIVGAEPPRGVRATAIVSTPVRVIEVRPAGPARGRLLFLHGGCYVFEITPQHYRFCQRLADALACKVSIPLYPLAPESTAVETQQKLRAVLAEGGPFDAWVGDSAGAGLALALAVGHHAEVPPLVLLSPWLDVSMVNPEIPAIDARDPWLSAIGLRECGRMYAGDLKGDDPRVSPIHGARDGALEHIPRIAIFIGTRDVMLPDARKLQRLAPEKVTLTEYPAMVHDFMLLRGIPESGAAFRDIVKTLNRIL